ncbi:MAG TPA: hypothetical protein VGI93_13015 [Steroidobacteraceae bacterium]
MPRRRATIAAAAVFAIGAAFAADPTSLRADWGESSLQHQLPWSPGAGSLMSAHDPAQQVAEPPR